MSKAIMNLKDIQTDIFSIVIGRIKNDASFVKSDKNLSATQRLHTYKNSSFAKVESCLSEDFQVCKNIIGEKYFSEILKGYIKLYPPNTHYINECGRHFPDFIKQAQITNHPYIYDLAKLEWMRVLSFYDFFNYNDKDINTSEVYINPSLKIIESQWPLHLIWDEEISYDKSSTTIFIWTTEDRSVHVDAWKELETNVLKEIIKKKSLEKSIEGLLDIHEADPLSEMLNKNLPIWVNKGLFEVNQNQLF